MLNEIQTVRLSEERKEAHSKGRAQDGSCIRLPSLLDKFLVIYSFSSIAFIWLYVIQSLLCLDILNAELLDLTNPEHVIFCLKVFYIFSSIFFKYKDSGVGHLGCRHLSTRRLDEQKPWHRTVIRSNFYFSKALFSTIQLHFHQQNICLLRIPCINPVFISVMEELFFIDTIYI